MAKKTIKARKAGSSSKKKSFFRIFKNETFKFTLGLLLLIIGIYTCIAFISFLFTGIADHSKLDLPYRSLLLDSSITVENKAGKTGAFISELLLNKGFGLSSFAFLYLIFILGIRLLGIKLVNISRTIVFSLLLLVWFSAAFGLFFSGIESNHYLYSGGQYGLVMSSWLSSLLGYIGAVFVLVFLLFLILIGAFNNLIPWIKGLFVAEESGLENNIEDGVNDEFADMQIKSSNMSKVITEEDTVETVFDPDSESEKDYEMDNTIRQKDVEESIENASEEKDTGDDDLEITVAETDTDNGEYENDPVQEDYDPTLDLSNYKYPTLDLLDEHASGVAEVTNEELISNKNKIVETLRHYKIEITKIRATIGPTITLYEIVPAPGIRIAKIKNLEDDIALSLAALGIRIIAPIPGRGTIGIEVPNQNPEIVSMRSIIGSKKFQESTAELPIALGKTISNEVFMMDLVKMPHILVAGATGQGKSVGLNAIITSLLYKKHPSQLKFVLVDPKKVELNLYTTLEKHFLAKMPDDEEPIITDIQSVKNTLNSLNIEMDARYELLKSAHVRNIIEYNKKFTSRRLNPQKGHRFLPYIVVIIDEFADLIMTAGKEIELPIARIAQLARAVGIHMIIATQRPSINIITGVIKANFPTRIAFKVASMIDSRTILDAPGANQLIGKGDMLVSSSSTTTRIQCAFVDTPEVEGVCNFISEQQGYPSALLLPEYIGENEDALMDTDLENRDEMFDDAARLVVSNQVGSTSMIQRKFSIGYNRAGRIMDQLEAAGIVGPSEGSKARQVLIQDDYSLEQLLNDL